jgi:NAD(P)-dependent dehydrogenase (short-subunit alcohol dehydrogenase family)
MSSNMNGKVALITGGTTGIGRSTAVALAKRGAKVVLTGRRESEGQQSVAMVKNAGGQASFFKADVSDPAQSTAMVDHTIKTYGRLDYAFNNAGIDETLGDFTVQTEDVFDRVMDINVKGVWRSMQAEVAAMLKSGGGSIVNTSSVAGVIGFPGAAVYTASKHAVIGLTKAAAQEYATRNIRINAVCPAAIQTDMIDRFAATPDVRNTIVGMHPIGRMGTPEEIAEAVIWLFSDAASFVVGHSLMVDGGFTAR